FLVTLANYLAFWLRFDGVIPNAYAQLMFETLPWLIAIRVLTFIPFQLYQGLWRYTGIWDLQNIIAGVLGSTVGFYLVLHLGLRLTGYPLSVVVIDPLLLIFLMGGLRLVPRLYQGAGGFRGEKRVL